MKDRIRFLQVGLFNRRIGAVVRSSRFVVEDVLAAIGTKQKFNCIVEYGPGDGVMTQRLIQCLTQDGVLLAVEANPNFLQILERIKDHRLKLIESTIQEVSANLSEFGLTHPEIVVASIPFSYLTPSERDDVTRYTAEALKPGGKFIIFHQYSRLMVKPLQKYFHIVDVKLEVMNFLPCFIITATK